jgi:predicted lipoprotein with Yx(FWY)xxD motif
VTGSPATAITLVVVLALALTGCGGDDASPQQPAAAPAPPPTTTEETKDMSTTGESAVALARRPRGEDGLRVPAKRARIVADDSGFGRVLFDANGQVVYVFENDRPNRSNCTSAECVKAWPPVLTRQMPSAGAGVDASKLGTIRRGDGTMQVTYNGRPLYFYEHEAPGEIKCHNVDLHGGLWWVVTPQGDPAD